jgi:hypothetical protein
MSNSILMTSDRSVGLPVQARDARNNVLARLCSSLYQAPETIIAKCYLEPRERNAAQALRPSDQPAVNPLMVRGLHIS